MLFALAVAGMIILRSRRGVLERIDRLFFREQYDARQTLGALVDKCRWVTNERALIEVVEGEIDRALHLQGVALLLLDNEGQTLASIVGCIRPLSADSEIVAALRQADEPLDYDLGVSGSVAYSLPVGDKHWLADGGFRYLLPLRDPQLTLIGVLALGEKRSELPYSREDWWLLTAVGSAAEMSIAYHEFRARREQRNVDSVGQPFTEAKAVECISCGVVHPSATPSCEICGGRIQECLLPQMFGGKLLVEQRIGTGGMGVVYRGLDVHLERRVAIKTLPYVSPEEAVRLRREARMMARVSHPNLALIFGAETWRGQPALLVEYLSGGTLTTRLISGPLTVCEALGLVLAIGGAVRAIHGAGVLHRDIKPSNIGFTEHGTPKLLDFGLARIMNASRSGSPINELEGRKSWLSGSVLTQSASLATLGPTLVHGTVLYMSPEALRGEEPTPALDLWSLCLVLYETIAGVNPLLGESLAHTRTRIMEAAIPDVREFAPSVHPSVATFLRQALSADPLARPTSAEALLLRLKRLPISSDTTEFSRPIASSA